MANGAPVMRVFLTLNPFPSSRFTLYILYSLASGITATPIVSSELIGRGVRISIETELRFSVMKSSLGKRSVISNPVNVLLTFCYKRIQKTRNNYTREKMALK